MNAAGYAWLFGLLIAAYFAAWASWWWWSCQKLERQLRAGEVQHERRWFTLWPLSGPVPLPHVRLLLVVAPAGAALWVIAAAFFAVAAWMMELPLVLGLVLAAFPATMAAAMLFGLGALQRAIARGGGLPPKP